MRLLTLSRRLLWRRARIPLRRTVARAVFDASGRVLVTRRSPSSLVSSAGVPIFVAWRVADAALVRWGGRSRELLMLAAGSSGVSSSHGQALSIEPLRVIGACWRSYLRGSSIVQRHGAPCLTVGGSSHISPDRRSTSCSRASASAMEDALKLYQLLLRGFSVISPQGYGNFHHQPF